MFYKIVNRNNLGDYGDIPTEDIQDVAYSVDMKTAIIKTEKESVLEQSNKKEFDNTRDKYIVYFETINKVDEK